MTEEKAALRHAFTVEDNRVRLLLTPGFTNMAKWGRPEDNPYVATRTGKGPVYANVVEIEYHRTLVGNTHQPETDWRMMRASVVGEYFWDEVFQEWDEDKKAYVTTQGAWGQDTVTYYGSAAAAHNFPMPEWLTKLVEEHRP